MFIPKNSCSCFSISDCYYGFELLKTALMGVTVPQQFETKQSQRPALFLKVNKGQFYNPLSVAI
jgi:hypothetical protein